MPTFNLSSINIKYNLHKDTNPKLTGYSGSFGLSQTIMYHEGKLSAWSDPRCVAALRKLSCIKSGIIALQHK